MDKHEPKETEWKWRYGFWTGIMYGPIPVGIIVVVIVFSAFGGLDLLGTFNVRYCHTAPGKDGATIALPAGQSTILSP